MARSRCDPTVKDLLRREYKMVMDIITNIIIIWGGSPRNKAQRSSLGWAQIFHLQPQSEPDHQHKQDIV